MVYFSYQMARTPLMTRNPETQQRVIQEVLLMSKKTVSLDGKGFRALVSQGDTVKAGDRLIEFDIEEIRAAGCSEQTMVIITNSDDYAEITAETGKTTDGTDKVVHLSRAWEGNSHVL